MPEDPRPFRIATRGSALALAQARLVQAQCQAVLPGLAVELNIIKTTGDKLLSASLANPGLPKGLFTKELEVALHNGEADLAVHSLKDLPTSLPDGLKLGAVSDRADVRDVLLFRGSAADQAVSPAGALDRLRPNAVVATSSTRRSAQLTEHRPDVKVVPIRGNVGTRLRKLAEQTELDAMLLAAAGLQRLGIAIQPDGRLAGPDVPAGLLAVPLPPAIMLPCVGQAALGMEIRADDPRAGSVCAHLDHPGTHACVLAERAFLRGMGGGCQLAVAAYARLQDERLHLQAVSYLAEKPRRAEMTGDPAAPEELGAAVARALQ